MSKRLLFIALVAFVFCIRGRAWAQFTDTHTYDNSPVGINQVELSYAYVRANASLDESLVITGAKLNLNQGMISYTRYFGLADHMAWVTAGVPFAGLSGAVTGTNISGSTNGAGDSSYQLGTLLKGGPALSVPQFENYTPTTTLGLSLTITAPTGLYQSNKILNLGSARWIFKPEVAVAHPFGADKKWQVEGYGNAYFYTDNTSYHGRQLLRQEPLPGLEGHISYSFNDNLWASLDMRYSWRGTTIVDGIDQNNAQQNFVLGSEVNVALNARNSLLFEFGKALVHQNGPALVGFAVKYDYTWGKGYR